MERDFYTKKMQAMFESMLEGGMLKVPTKQDFKELKAKNTKFLGLPIAREVVESGDIEDTVTFFENIKATKSYFKGCVLFSISGYDYDLRELYEIKEVVDWIRKLVDRVPYIFYYVEHSSWAFMQCCVADKVTSFTKFGEKIDVHEATRRMFMGEEIPVYQNYLQADSRKIANIISSLKLLGSEIGDLKGANEIHRAFASSFVDRRG